MKNIILTFCFFLPILCSAHAAPDTIYTDRSGTITTRDKAAYYSLVKDLSKKIGRITWTQEDYYMENNVLASTCPMSYTKVKQWQNYDPVSSYFASAVIDGLYLSYDKNGKLQNRAVYHNGIPKGLSTGYYPDGSVKSIASFKNRKRYLFHYYDSTGTDLLQNGNGIVQLEDKEQGKYYIEVIDSVQSSVFIVDEQLNDTIYTRLAHMPQPQKGWPQLFRKVSRSVEDWQRKKFDGKQLNMELVVNKDGTLDTIKKLNTINPELDELLIDRIRTFSPFTAPSLSNGKKVTFRLRIYIPIEY